MTYTVYHDESPANPLFGNNQFFDQELGMLENVRNLQNLNEDPDVYMDDVYYGNDYLEDAYEEDDGYY